MSFAMAEMIKLENLSPDVFLPDLRATDKWGVIHEIIGHFRGLPHVQNLGDWEAEVVQREKLCPTILRPGVALPHARTRAVNQLVWGLAVSVQGICFEPSSSPVHLIILVGTPPSLVKQYLEFISHLTRWLRTGTPAMDPRLAKCKELIAALRKLRGSETSVLSNSA